MWKIKTFFAGMCMGAADIVPGISGGTVAFILGIYEELLRAIASINRTSLKKACFFRFKEFFRDISGPFLLLLIAGIATSFVIFAKLFQGWLNDPFSRSILYSLFLGLVLGSVKLCKNKVARWNSKCYLAAVVGAVIAFILSGSELMQFAQNQYQFDVPVQNIDLEKAAKAANFDLNAHQLLNVPEAYLPALNEKGFLQEGETIFSSSTKTPVQFQSSNFEKRLFSFDPFLVIAGSIAVSAMLLPGISGSYMLQIMGVYPIAIGAVVEFIEALRSGSFESESFSILASISFGIIIGAIFFSRFIRMLLSRYHDMTVALLIGFMLGALRAVWPFWSYSYELDPAAPERALKLIPLEARLPIHAEYEYMWVVGMILIGFSIVWLLDIQRHKLQSRKQRGKNRHAISS